MGAAPLADVLRIIGKGGRERLVPVLPVARAAVERYCVICPWIWRMTHRYFAGSAGLNARAIRTLPLSACAGVAEPKRHMRCATAATTCYSGGDLRAIQELRHASLSTTRLSTAVDTHLDVYKRAHPVLSRSVAHRAADHLAHFKVAFAGRGFAPGQPMLRDGAGSGKSNSRRSSPRVSVSTLILGSKVTPMPLATMRTIVARLDAPSVSISPRRCISQTSSA